METLARYHQRFAHAKEAVGNIAPRNILVAARARGKSVNDMRVAEVIAYVLMPSGWNRS